MYEHMFARAAARPAQLRSCVPAPVVATAADAASVSQRSSTPGCGRVSRPGRPWSGNNRAAVNPPAPQHELQASREPSRRAGSLTLCGIHGCRVSAGVPGPTQRARAAGSAACGRARWAQCGARHPWRSGRWQDGALCVAPLSRRPVVGLLRSRASSRRWSWRMRDCTSCARRCLAGWSTPRASAGRPQGRVRVCRPAILLTASSSRRRRLACCLRLPRSGRCCASWTICNGSTM